MIQPPVTVILLWLMLKSGTNINLLPASWQIGNLAAAIAVALVAERSLNLRILMSVGDILLFRPLPGGQIRKTAAPMFVVMVGLPIALQSDRIILSNQTNLTEVANYSVVATLQGPLLALTAATGTALWPHFTRRRDTPGVRSDFIQALVAFVVAGLFAALGLVIFGPLLTPVVSKDQASVGLFVFFAAAMVIAIQSAHTPAGMFLTDEEGLRFQAKTVTAMALANLLLSWVLADKYGAAGPYLGTAISIGVCQLGPTLWVAFKRLQVEPSMPPAAE
jgi:O-antigen/teichoic acid export membrane protein